MSRSATEKAKAIRQELKRRFGYTGRDVSVRADYFSLGSAVRIKIKRPDIAAGPIQAIASEHERIHRCEMTGEILGGGNCYISPHYSHDVDKIHAEKWREPIEKAEAAVTGSSLLPIDGSGGFLLGKADGWRLTLWLPDDRPEDPSGRMWGGHCLDVHNVATASQTLERLRLDWAALRAADGPIASTLTPASPQPSDDPGAAESVSEITVSEGKRPGYVEVRFPAKPDDETRAELKAAGFRWSRRNGCWYGQETSLPERYGAGPTQERAAKGPVLLRDPAEDAADRWAETQGGAL